MVFGYNPQQFGLSLPYWMDDKEPQPTAATIHTSFMAYLFGTILAHEMGHCFGLKHDGHDGMENIMFTMDKEEYLDKVTGTTVVEYLLLGGEPRFTQMYGENAWKWKFTKASKCIFG